MFGKLMATLQNIPTYAAGNAGKAVSQTSSSVGVNSILQARTCWCSVGGPVPSQLGKMTRCWRMREDDQMSI